MLPKDKILKLIEQESLTVVKVFAERLSEIALEQGSISFETIFKEWNTYKEEIKSHYRKD